MRLCDAYPFFRDIYKHIYEICQNTEDVMGIFSEALAELDRNTVDYMIDELKRSNEQLQDKNELLEDRIQHLQKELDDMRKLLREQSEQ